jgi:hypothetical protein
MEALAMNLSLNCTMDDFSLPSENVETGNSNENRTHHPIGRGHGKASDDDDYGKTTCAEARTAAAAR